MGLYITSQVLAFIGIAIDLVGRTMKSKKYILIFTVVASLFYVASYLFLTKPLPAIINGINLVRSLIYVFINDKNKPVKAYLPTMISAIILSVISVAIFWNNAMDLFMVASILILAIGLAFKNMLTVRICLIVNSVLWCIYNFTLKGYVNMACDLINILVVVIAIIMYNIVLPRREKQKQVVNNEQPM